MRIDMTSRRPLPDEAVLADELRKVQLAEEGESRAEQDTTRQKRRVQWSAPSGSNKPRKERSEAEIAEHRENRKLSVEQVLARLKAELHAAWDCAEVVGRWVWVTLPTKPHESVTKKLYAIGFQWNFKRKCWQHPCGEFAGHSKADPRFKYDRVSVREFEEDPLSYSEPANTAKPVILIPATRWSPVTK